jgi:hypothetical protein
MKHSRCRTANARFKMNFQDAGLSMQDSRRSIQDAGSSRQDLRGCIIEIFSYSRC